MAPNSRKMAGSGTRSRRRPSRSGLSRGLEAGRRRDSAASRRSRIVRGASFFGAAGVGATAGAGVAPGAGAPAVPGVPGGDATGSAARREATVTPS